eukprot:scaffold158498_cov15-Tisochrysis_lutea.AAC.1
MLSTRFTPGSREPRYLVMVTLLAVPLSPTSRMGLPLLTMVCSSQVVLHRSTDAWEASVERATLPACLAAGP